MIYIRINITTLINCDMCGRFSVERGEDVIRSHFHIKKENSQSTFSPRYNISPSQKIPVFLERKEEMYLQDMIWGLIPSWSKNTSFGDQLINARAETVFEKPAFRTAIKKRRCIIPASGFFEWKKEGTRKFPYYIRPLTHDLMSFAGIYEIRKSFTDNWQLTCAIITTKPNNLMKSIHDRMPLILPSSRIHDWLNHDTHKDQLIELMGISNIPLEAYMVSQLVNNPINETKKCIEPKIVEANGKIVYLKPKAEEQSSLQGFFEG